MMHSLLWRAGSPPEAERTRLTDGDDLLAALSLDRALTVILPDVAERRALTAILTAPAPTAADIVHRQAVMRELLASPALLEELRELFLRLTELKKLADDGRRAAIAAQSRSGEEALFSGARSRLEMAALSLRRTLLLLREADARLSTRTIVSTGLRTLTDRIHAIAAAPDTAEMLARLAPLSALSESTDYRFALALDADGRVAQHVYLDRAPLPEPPSSPKKKRFGGRKAEPVQTHEAVLASPRMTLPRRLAAEGMTDAAVAVEHVASALFAELLPVSRELSFFSAGLRFSAFFAARGLPTPLPDLADDGRQIASGIYDPYLAATLPTGATVVCNELGLAADCPGIVVTGANNAGKTVWLRAAGSVILLGQAGFPVCAASATVTPTAGLRSCFASAERIERAGSEAGRFEEEVRSLAAAVEASGTGELLLLNEPFQTTAYAEGAAGLGTILRYLTARGTRWVLVTHLDVPLDSLDEAHRMVCLPDHRIVNRIVKKESTGA